MPSSILSYILRVSLAMPDSVGPLSHAEFLAMLSAELQLPDLTHVDSQLWSETVFDSLGSFEVLVMIEELVGESGDLHDQYPVIRSIEDAYRVYRELGGWD